MFDVKKAAHEIGPILAKTLSGPGETAAQLHSNALEADRARKAQLVKRAKWRDAWHARQARVKERLAAGLPPSGARGPGRALMIALWHQTGNPRPAFLDDRDDAFREMRYRAMLKRMVERAARLTAAQPGARARKRVAIDVTRKRVGSVRFERLNALLGVMDTVPGSTAKRVKP